MEDGVKVGEEEGMEDGILDGFSDVGLSVPVKNGKI
jgi:hypothetical protein